MNRKVTLASWFCSLMRSMMHRKSFALGETEQIIDDVRHQMDTEDQNHVEIYTDIKECFFNIIKRSHCYAHGYVVSTEQKKKTSEVIVNFMKQDCPNTNIRLLHHN